MFPAEFDIPDVISIGASFKPTESITIAALQRIFPNQARAQVSAVFLFFLNLGGFPLGAILPGFLNDRAFGSEAIGTAAAITIGVAAVMMIVAFGVTAKPYRAHYKLMQLD